MYRWCSRCNERRAMGQATCPVCRHSTDIELDLNDTLRIDDRREFVITKQLSHYTDAGMSAVYLAARKDKPNMYGAIKVAKSSKVEALKREAEHLQKLKHDHIIRLVHPERALWQDRKDNTLLYFFALEYMDGGSLKDKLKQKNKLSLAEATPIILAIGQALSYAHQNNFYHLDVKPANVLFGSDGRVVLSDFGITRDSSQAHDLKRRVGTFFYNAPEQLTNNPQHTHKADIFALGIILYEMLVGSKQFHKYRSSSSSKSDSRSSGGANVQPNPSIGAALPPPRKLNSRIPRPVEQVILKATAPDPGQRYDSVTMMLDDLATAVSRSSSQKKFLLPLVGIGILLAIALIALGIVSLFFLRPTPTPEPLASDPSTPTPTVEAPTTESSLEIIVATQVLSTPTPSLDSVDSGAAGSTEETPTKVPTATRRPTSTPTPAPVRVVRTPTAAADGRIEVITPTDNKQLESDVVEFQWRWHENKGCQQPPEGFAFEIRVWPDNNTDVPLGAMDAKAEKPNIRCDPNTGIRTFTITKIREVPGVGGRGAGRFRWEVALVRIDPYDPKGIVTSQYRTFFF